MEKLRDILFELSDIDPKDLTEENIKKAYDLLETKTVTDYAGYTHKGAKEIISTRNWYWNDIGESDSCSSLGDAVEFDNFLSSVFIEANGLYSKYGLDDYDDYDDEKWFDEMLEEQNQMKGV